jgi:hypothetical protein
VADVRHADALGVRLDRVLRLLLRADEEDGAAALGDAAREVVRLVEQLLRLLQVDDVDAPALVEDEALHLRVPAAGLVAEVDSGLQELLHGDDGHDQPLSRLDSGAAGGGIRGDRLLGSRPPPRGVGRRGEGTKNVRMVAIPGWQSPVTHSARGTL